MKLVIPGGSGQEVRRDYGLTLPATAAEHRIRERR
jgi:hypothetical protein